MIVWICSREIPCAVDDSSRGDNGSADFAFHTSASNKSEVVAVADQTETSTIIWPGLKMETRRMAQLELI
jgi:hypothetical protein